MGLQALKIEVVKTLGRCILDRAFHPLGVTIRPRVVGPGQLVVDAVGEAEVAEHMWPPLSGDRVAVPWRVGGVHPVVGQDRVWIA